MFRDVLGAPRKLGPVVSVGHGSGQVDIWMANTRMSMLVLVLGGSRSGKSVFAERALERGDGPLLYFATAEITDENMAARVETHRARRSERYTTIEASAALADALRSNRAGPAMVDSLGTWLVNFEDFRADIDGMIDALGSRQGPTFVVSEEVGLGVHPSTESGRVFMDTLGVLNQRVADAADEVWMVIAGRGLRLEKP